jgi:hypothetical protein
MAAYPSIGLNADIEPITQRIVDISDAGTIRSADLNNTTVYRIKITHPIITSAEKSTLLTFYTTNKNNSNTITLDGDAYTTQFESDYEVSNISATWFSARVSLVGTK